MKYFSKIVILVLIFHFAITASVNKINDLNTLSAKVENNDSLKRKTLKGIYNKLLKHVISSDGRVNKFTLSFGNNDDERFIVATEDIAADEAILKIPEKLIISPAHPLLKDFCGKVEEFSRKHKLEHDSHELCLQLWVSKERHNITKSKFQDFVAFLPINFDNFPILYNNKEMKILKNTFLEELIESEKKYLEEDYNTIKENDASLLGGISQKEFNQAYELFYSRTYQFNNGRGQSITGFIPLVDLFNYKTGLTNKVSWKYNETTNQFIVYAESDIKKGSKLFIEYGSHSNFQYLTFYGFTIKDNPVRPSYNIYVGNEEKQVIVDITGDINIMKTLEPLRRKFALKRESNNTPKILSISNEIACLKALKHELDVRVVRWKTTLQQDLLRLKNAVDVNEKNILRVIAEEKKIIKIYQSMTVHFINILQHKKHSTLNKAESKLVVLNPHFRAYFEQLNSELGLDMKSATSK